MPDIILEYTYIVNMSAPPLNYCQSCGAPVAHRVPDGDHMERAVCDVCDTIHYVNPKLVVGTIPEYTGRILLCRRAIDPRSGFWTLPAGFMENGETTAEGGQRETREEACAEAEDLALFSVLDVRHVNQVHLFFRATLAEPVYSAGPESLDVDLFNEDAIPWDELAFATVRYTLEHWFADRKAGHFGLHTADIAKTSAFKQIQR